MKLLLDENLSRRILPFLQCLQLTPAVHAIA
jgi:hypothetical protein